MNNFAKRSLSVLMALAMCVSLLSGIAVTASAAAVDYVTGAPADSGYTGVIKNWGKRGVDATFLSPNAETFYESNDVRYDDLAALSGASATSEVPSSELYAELYDLMAGNHENITSYGDVRYLMAYTDCQENGTGTNGTYISSFYSGTNIGPVWDSGATWNREHVWPNSKSNSGSDNFNNNTISRESDIIMLRPAATSENSSRGNKAYGESSGYYNPNEENGGNYDLRGDVARTVLYVYVRWGGSSDHDGALDYMWGSSGVIESKEVLLKWMEKDPVDTWELARNDSVESITGTRNVFVDYPELAFLLFNEEIPSDMTTPSGEAVAPEFTITATVNNSSYGTVAQSGNTITAFPTTGYAVAGYEVTSGSATVQQDGNVFTVTASSDCTVQILFSEQVEAQLAFTENGETVSARAAYAGEVITLPDNSGPLGEGYAFVGWVTAELAETAEAPSAICLAGSTYTIQEAVTFHALYSRVDATTADGNAYTLATGIAEGDYLIVADNAAMKAAVNTECFAYTDVTIVNSHIGTPDASVVWHIAPTEDGYYTIYNASTGSYAAGTGYSNASGTGTLVSTVTDFAKWSITLDSSGIPVFTNLGNANKSVSSTLRKYSTFGFATYAPATGTAPCLYEKTTNTVLYSTEIIDCGHSNTQRQDQENASCDKSGCTGDLICLVCGTLLEADQPLAATGHKDTDNNHICDGCGGAFSSYEKITSLSVGDTVLLVCESKQMELSSISTTSTKYGVGTAYEDMPAGVLPLTVVAGYAEGTVAFQYGNNYLSWSSGNSLMTATTLTAKSSWNVTFDSDGNAIILNAADTTRKLQWNASAPRFACYTSSQTAVQLYGLTIGETPACDHVNTELQNVVTVSCTADGYTGDEVCLDCGEIVATGKVMEKTGHTYEAAVTDPTITEPGYTTYTCACGDSYVDDYTAPLAVAKIGDVLYTDVSDALAAARSGETVVLIADAKEDYVIITSGVTLDLSAYTLTANYVIGLKGGYLTAQTVDTDGNGGKLIVAEENISLSEAAPVSAANATANVIPVWNEDHYIFTMARIRASGDGLVISEDGNTVELNFATTFSGYVRNLLHANGSVAHDLSIIVTAKWENAALGADLRQEFVFNDDMVKAVSANSNNSYYATLGGCNSKSNLVLQLMIVTDCGVVVYSVEYPVNVVE